MKRDRPVQNGSFVDFGALCREKLKAMYEGADQQEKEKMREILKDTKFKFPDSEAK